MPVACFRRADRPPGGWISCSAAVPPIPGRVNRSLRRSSLLAAVIAVALAAAGCGGSASSLESGPAPVSTTTSGWKVYAPKRGGYRVEIPAEWATIDAGSLARSGAVRRLQAANPDMARAFPLFAQMARQPGVLIAFDRTAAGRAVTRRSGFAPNIIVRRIPLDPSDSDAALLRAVIAKGEANVASMPAVTGGPSVARLTMAGLPAAALTYTARENTSAGTATVRETDYATVRDGTAYTIYCTTLRTDVARLRPACAHAISSFAFAG